MFGRNTGAITLCVIFTSCTHDLTREIDLENDPVYRNDQARSLLAAADFEGARQEYRAVLDLDPANGEAAFGWALSDLLLLPDSAPIRRALDRCNQPRLDVARDVFGPSGVLARAEAANAGLAQVTVHHRDQPLDGARDLQFSPDAVKTEIVEYPGERGPERWLDVSIRERSGETPRWLELRINLDDGRRNDEAITPVVAGATFPVADLDGWLSFTTFDGGGGFGSGQRQAGTIRFVRAGRAPGEPVELAFENVTLPAHCEEPGCQSEFVISGLVNDALSAPATLELENLPFGDLQPDPGPPHRDELIVSLERCDQLDTAFLAGELEALGDLLAAQSAALQVIVDAPETARAFSFTVPRRLLHTREDLPLNIADVRFLKAVIDLGSALAELAGQYRYLQGSLQSMITDQDLWSDDFTPGGVGPELRRERALTPALMVMALDAWFLTEDEGFEVETFRARFRAALLGVADALRERPEQPGLTSFDALPVRRLAGELADLFDAAAGSIDSSSPIALPSAPWYRFAFHRYFASPLTQARLEQLSGLQALFELRPGDPGASTAGERNSAVSFVWGRQAFEGGVQQLFSWTGDLIELPEDKSEVSCENASTCGTGYTCESLRCTVQVPYLATSGAWQGAFHEDWPLFLSPAIRDVFDFGF